MPDQIEISVIREAARHAGVSAARVELIRRGSHAIYRLPDNLVARLGSSDRTEAAEHEVAVAQWLRRHGIDCVQPATNCSQPTVLHEMGVYHRDLVSEVARDLAETGPGGTGRDVLAGAAGTAQAGADLGHGKAGTELGDQACCFEDGVVAAAVAPAEHLDPGFGQLAEGRGLVLPFLPIQPLPLDSRHIGCPPFDCSTW